MEYFLLKQDERCTDIPMIKDLFNKIDKRNISMEKEVRIDDINVFHVRGTKKSVFADVLERQLYIVSESIKNLLEMHGSHIIFKTVFLIDRTNRKQKKYFIPIFPKFDCLHESSEFNLDKSVIKKIVIDRSKVKGRAIFKIDEGDKTCVVVSLELAESIRKSGFLGICLEPLNSI